jgi:hypothetical protein
VLGSTTYTRLAVNAALRAKLPTTRVRKLSRGRPDRAFRHPDRRGRDRHLQLGRHGADRQPDPHLQRQGRADALPGAEATLDGTSPTAGAVFAWDGLIPGAGNGQGSQILRRRAEREHSDEFEIRAAWDQATVSSDMGTFFSAAVG